MAELPPISAPLDGPFRTNVRQLLSEVADRQPCSLAGTSKWRMTLGDGQKDSAELLVFEEDVLKTGKLYCEQCRVIGWGHHPVSCSRFHFILPSDDSATVLDTAERRCPSCEATCPAVSNECPQCGADLRRTSVLEVQSHLLHGVLHSNGFGHLMRVNGRERGSQVLSGSQLMDLWDRLCDMLKARDVSVQDVSKKYGLDFRILHAVAYSSTWYGRWGYQFGRGSFGVSKEAYNAAVKLLQDLPLVTISEHFEAVDHMVPFIIARYQILSGRSVKTLAELYRFMLDLRQTLPDRGRDEHAHGLDRAARKARVQKETVGHHLSAKKTAVVKIRIGRAALNGKVGTGPHQSPFRLRGFIHGPLNGIARARTQNLRRPALTAKHESGYGKSSPKPVAETAAPVKKLSPREDVPTPTSPRKRTAIREESPAPRRTRQRLEEEARVLGLSGTGFKRDGSLDSEAALRRKAKRARLCTGGGGDEWQVAKGGAEVSNDGNSLPPSVAGADGGASSPQARSSGQACEPAASEAQTGRVGRNRRRPPRPARSAPGPQPTLQLSYSPPPHKASESEVGESGRSAGKHPIPEGSRSKLVRTFDSSRESTRSPSVDSGKSRYSPRRIDDAIKALVGIMRALPENAWMTRVSLKEKARAKIGDTGLLNYALRVVENLEVGGGCVVRRMVHPDSHVMEYRLDYLGSHAVSGTSPEAAGASPESSEAAGKSRAIDGQTWLEAGDKEVGRQAPTTPHANNTEASESRTALVTTQAVGNAADMGPGESIAPKVEPGPLIEPGDINTPGASNKAPSLAEGTAKAAVGQTTQHRVGPSAPGQLDSGLRAERPRRSAGPLSPQRSNAGSASRDTLSKADVVKDLRYIQQHVVLTYKAARKIRRTVPTTPFGTPENPLETTPLGESGWKGDEGALPGVKEEGGFQEEGQNAVQGGGAQWDNHPEIEKLKADGLDVLEMKRAVSGAKREDGVETNAAVAGVLDEEANQDSVPKQQRSQECTAGDALAYVNRQEGGEGGGQLQAESMHREGGLVTTSEGGLGLQDMPGAPSRSVDPDEVLRATKAVHNTKKFIKSYHWAADSLKCQDKAQVWLLFGVKLHDGGANPRAKCDPPAELLVLPQDATLKDLKAEGSLAFQEMYVIMKRFRVTRVEGWADTSDRSPIAPLLAREGRRGLGTCAELTGEGEGEADVSKSNVTGAGLKDPGRVRVAVAEQQAGEKTTGDGGTRSLRSRSGTAAGSLGGAPLVEESVTVRTEQAEAASLEQESVPGKTHGLCHVTGTGTGEDLASEARFEAGLECWVVDCLCGTKDDDGERMAECDRCGTWMHTRCLKIRDRDSVPAVVVCARCSPQGQAKQAKGRAARKAAKAGASDQGAPLVAKPGFSEPADNAIGGRSPPAVKHEAELDRSQPKREAGNEGHVSKVAGLTWQSKGGPNGTRLIVGLVSAKNDGKRDLRRQLDTREGERSVGGDEQMVKEGDEKKLEGKGPSGVKKKRSAAGGDRRGPRNLEYLNAAVRDLASGKR